MARRALLILMLLGLMATLPGSVWAAAPVIAVTVQAGNEGRVRPGGWVTVLVDLVNEGREASLELVLSPVPDNPEGNRVEYGVPVQLPAGRKKRVPVEVPTYGNTNLAVELRSGGAQPGIRRSRPRFRLHAAAGGSGWGSIAGRSGRGICPEPAVGPGPVGPGPGFVDPRPAALAA